MKKSSEKEIDGIKFVEEFLSIPKRKIKTKTDLKKIFEEEYETS